MVAAVSPEQYARYDRSHHDGFIAKTLITRKTRRTFLTSTAPKATHVKRLESVGSPLQKTWYPLEPNSLENSIRVSREL